MNQTELYKQLQEVAERLGILFMEKNFRIAGVPVKSGLCLVNGRHYFYMDKFLKIKDKNKILSESIIGFPIDEIYIPPAVREMLEKAGKGK